MVKLAEATRGKCVETRIDVREALGKRRSFFFGDVATKRQRARALRSV